MVTIKFGGTVRINAPIDAVLKFASDMRMVSSCIPDSQNFKQIDDRNFTTDVTMKIAFISGVFAVRGAMTQQAPTHLAYSLEGSGIGSTIRIVLLFDLNPKDANSTEVVWSAESDLHGVASGISESILRKESEEKIEGTIANVKANLEKPGGG